MAPRCPEVTPPGPTEHLPGAPIFCRQPSLPPPAAHATVSRRCPLPAIRLLPFPPVSRQPRLSAPPAVATTTSARPGTVTRIFSSNPALHIDGTLQVSAAAAHSVPYDTHKADVVAAGGNTTCLGCHAMGRLQVVYPAAVAGNPPDCMSCHQKAAPVHTGTVAGANCSSCHGLSTATTTRIGRPVGTAYPDRLGFHSGASDGAHGTAACIVCHNGAGTTSGNNSGVNHGKGSTAGPVRNGKPNVVGPMVNGITPTTSAKGVGIPANGSTCVHGTINSGLFGWRHQNQQMVELNGNVRKRTGQWIS